MTDSYFIIAADADNIDDQYVDSVDSSHGLDNLAWQLVTNDLPLLRFEEGPDGLAKAQAVAALLNAYDACVYYSVKFVKYVRVVEDP